MLQRLRQVHDRDLTPEQLAEREVWRRKHEIDAQIVVALEKGNPVDLLLNHPAGLMKNPGGCKHLNADDKLETAYIIQRYADLKGRWSAGQHFIELDEAISGRVRDGKRKGDPEVDALAEIKVRCVKARRGEMGADAQKFARARGHKDLSEFGYQAKGKATGWLRELSNEELLAEHEQRVAETLEAINAERVELGLPKIMAVEA